MLVLSIELQHVSDLRADGSCHTKVRDVGSRKQLHICVVVRDFPFPLKPLGLLIDALNDPSERLRLWPSFG